MRGDILKVVNERAKSNRTWASKTPRVKQVLIDPDGDQFDESTNSIRRKRQKDRNQHFNAVEHFLIRNVGRPWSKVYAEICASTDDRTLLGMEIRDWVLSSVATKCWIEGRRLMCHDWGGCLKEVRGLYVHPRSGLLNRTGP